MIWHAMQGEVNMTLSDVMEMRRLYGGWELSWV